MLRLNARHSKNSLGRFRNRGTLGRGFFVLTHCRRRRVSYLHKRYFVV